MPTLTGSNASATDKFFIFGKLDITGSIINGIISQIENKTGNLIVYVTGTFEIIYVGKDVNGVVIEKGSVTVNVTS